MCELVGRGSGGGFHGDAPGGGCRRWGFRSNFQTDTTAAHTLSCASWPQGLPLGFMKLLIASTRIPISLVEYYAAGKWNALVRSGDG